MAGFEKGKKYDVVDAEQGDCVGCCFNKDGCTLDISIPCREGFIYKEIKESDNERLLRLIKNLAKGASLIVRCFIVKHGVNTLVVTKYVQTIKV